MKDESQKKVTAEELLGKEFLDQIAANERMAELGKISAGVIHELNTPLSVIVSAAQMILREHDLSAFVQEMVERIGSEAQRLSHLTRGILSFSREGAGSAGETDVNEVLADVLALLRYDIGKRSVALRENLDYRLPMVSADANSLKQIFLNLIMNALQAMEETGGGLTVSTAAAAGDTVEIRIGDTGSGIPAEVEKKIFDPFFTTKEAGVGTGLGLFVTKNLVGKLGGWIGVTTGVGTGTEFAIRLRAAKGSG
jgi:signal transduction histidine kinase